MEANGTPFRFRYFRAKGYVFHGLGSLGTKGYAFRNYYTPLFLLTRKARKRIKNLSGFIAFCSHLIEIMVRRLHKQAFTHFGDTVAVVCRFAHKS